MGGLAASWNSLTRVVSPIVGSFLLDRVSPAAPGLMGAAIMGVMVWFAWWQILFVPDMSCPLPEV